MSELLPAYDPIAAGRAALSGGRWLEARAPFQQALARAPAPEALERLGWAAWWLEDVPGCLDTRERAYRMYRRAGDARGAARVALWLEDAHIEFRTGAGGARGARDKRRHDQALRATQHLRRRAGRLSGAVPDRARPQGALTPPGPLAPGCSFGHVMRSRLH